MTIIIFVITKILLYHFLNNYNTFCQQRNHHDHPYSLDNYNYDDSLDEHYNNIDDDSSKYG